MPQQQIPWWMQLQGSQQPPPTGDPNFRNRLGPEAGGGTFGSIGATAPQQTSSTGQGPFTGPDFSGGGIDLPPATDFNPDATLGSPEQTFASPPQQPFTRFFAGTPVTAPANVPYLSYGGWNAAEPNNPPTNEGMTQSPVDQYQYDNPVPNEGLAANPVDQYQYDNPAPDENMAAPATQSYYGGGFNPVPNEGMIPNEAPTWQQPDITNPAPNEDMVANPIAPDPTQSGLSLSGTPDLSIGDNSIQPLNYYPDGSGGYVVYDQNWNVVNNMPGTGGNAVSNEPQTPSTVATGAYPTPPGATPDVLPAGAAPPTPAGAGNLVPPPGLPALPGSWNAPTNYQNLYKMAGNAVDTVGNAVNNAVFNPDVGYYNQDYLSSIGYTPGGGTGSLWPGEGFSGAKGGPLAGSFAGLGSGGGGSIANLDPFQNAWQGNVPYSQSNFNNWVGWQNSQGNALAGAQWYPGQTPGPVLYQPTAGGNYSSYLSAWNSANGGSSPNENIPSGNFGQPSHSGTTSAQ